MKKLFLLLAFLGIFQISYAQDSIRVTYSQESDTLVKQRFIDRYENVFMTKVPTRQMLKVGYSGFGGVGFRIGYEYKILPNFSLEAAVFTTKNQYNAIPISYSETSDIWMNANARWYYNMGKRVNQEMRSSNFSGGYFGLSYEQALHYASDGPQLKERGRFGLLYGFQSRFFNRGYIDMSVGLFNRGYIRDLLWVNLYEHRRYFTAKDFVLTTRSSFGFALGDWKKSRHSPACEVLLCDEQVSGQWKLQIPNITLGLRLQRGNTSIAYERRIGQSPFWVQADVHAEAVRNAGPFISLVTYQAGSGVELRYYYIQKAQVRRGTGGGNLSGPYLGVGATTFIPGFDSNIDSGKYKDHAWYHAATASWGYQQRLFKRIYVDGSLSYSHILNDSSTYLVPPKMLSIRVAFGFTF
ncbi:hypothetical protein [Dyadobacter luticola]|uniref:DUF4421 domain-containing protein n=1 Tax=Dyadobacter luticola TaxID=1979387 RepID=A0A5R9L1D2_9BACT|nr:hypothetical protein [Dyadobacter luticola]TLV02177.1 hypothetical protein FEN17_00620 [Dyadobacter luticola]